MLGQTLKAMPEPLPPDLFIAAVGQRPSTGSPMAPTRHYATEFGLIAVDAAHDKLCAYMTGEIANLSPSPDGWLGLDADGSDSASPVLQELSRLRFQTRRIDGRTVVVAKTDQGELLLGEQLPPEPPPATWLARLGSWRVLHPDPGFPISDLTLKLTDGQLCLSYRMPVVSSKRIQVPVRAAGPDSGTILGLGSARGETVRIVNQGESLTCAGPVIWPSASNRRARPGRGSVEPEQKATALRQSC